MVLSIRPGLPQHHRVGDHQPRPQRVLHLGIRSFQDDIEKALRIKPAVLR